ncbi:MAG: PKD domain-containing protein [Promethearchaeota archaeon]
MRELKNKIILIYFVFFLGIINLPLLQNNNRDFNEEFNHDNNNFSIIKLSAPIFSGCDVAEWTNLSHPDSGESRHVIVYIPDTYDPNIPSAVLYACHGWTQNIESWIQGSKCYQIAQDCNAIVIVPQGNNRLYGLPGWMWDDRTWETNIDVQFFSWFLDYLENNDIIGEKKNYLGGLNLNRRRMYLGGYSQGGSINTCAGADNEEFGPPSGIGNSSDFAAFYHIAGGNLLAGWDGNSSPVGNVNATINAERKYPAHVIVGSDDTLMSQTTQDLLWHYQTEGHPYYYKMYNGLDHLEIYQADLVDPEHPGSSYYLDLWDWLVQWAINQNQATLSDGEITPNPGDLSQEYTFTVNWTDSDNDAPYNGLNLIIDGVIYEMEKQNNDDNDYTDGCIYTKTLAGIDIGNGTHDYYFTGMEGDNYGMYNIIEAGTGPYETSTARYPDLNNLSLTITNPSGPVAAFIANTTSIVEDQSIEFIFFGWEGNAPTSYYWDFGDGDTSIEQNPTHQYTTCGTYNVSLNVTDTDGNVDIETKLDYIEVMEDLQPISNFIANETIIFEGDIIAFNFTGSEGNAPTSYYWDFGDGGSSTYQNSTHQYDIEGIYSVILTVSDNDGDTDINIKIDFVNVTKKNQPQQLYPRVSDNDDDNSKDKEAPADILTVLFSPIGLVVTGSVIGLTVIVILKKRIGNARL